MSRYLAVRCIAWLDADVTSSLSHFYFRSGDIAEIHFRSRRWLSPAPNREAFVVLPNSNPKLISGNVHNVPHDELSLEEIIRRKAHVNVVTASIPLAFYVCWLGIVIEQNDSPVWAELIISPATSCVYACPYASEIGFANSSMVTLVAVD